MPEPPPQTIVIHAATTAAPTPQLPTAPVAVVPQALSSSVTAKLLEAARKQQQPAAQATHTVQLPQHPESNVTVKLSNVPATKPATET